MTCNQVICANSTVNLTVIFKSGKKLSTIVQFPYSQSLKESGLITNIFENIYGINENMSNI